MNLLLGNPESDHVSVGLPDSANAEDWITTNVRISVGKFSAELEPMLEMDDLLRFRRELSALYNELRGSATLEGRREGQFSLEIVGNGRGGMTIEGTAYANATRGSKLSFEFSLDQTHLAPVLSSLSAFVECPTMRLNRP